MLRTEEYDSEPIYISSDSISNSSSISLGVNQEAFMHTQPNSEASESMYSLSDSLSNSSSISLGVNQGAYMHTQPNSEVGDNDANGGPVEAGAVVAQAPVPFAGLVVNSPEFMARVDAAVAEISAYSVASDAMDERITRLDIISLRDRTESEERFPDMGHLHHINYHLRLTRIRAKCQAAAGPAADYELHLVRVARILDGLPVPPIEEVQAQVVEEENGA
ncbi:hypothetical protein RSOLAG22IIIB_10433 [Rhizoctonia solani]|uniref:Uncharacterized protein n=1 Tax=Rhizoctonia solani TaxID=456999 RepID=A0A0K6G3Z9_9AGAM|nr:hypothetical protein RSOLAG22IIIB_10433 [Rhizoctonia solani]